MPKFIFTFIFLLLTFSLNYVSPTFAGTVGVGGECEYNDANCLPGLKCVVAGDQGQISVCAQPAVDLQCSCQNKDENGGSAGIGKNGISCQGRSEVAYCAANEACYNDANGTYDPTIGGTIQNPFGNASLKGIRCAPAAQTVTCSCAADGQIQCTQGGNTETRKCIDPDARCVAAPGDSFQYNPALFGDPDPFFGSRDIVIKDVACKKPAATCSCVNPNKQGNGQNGVHCEFTKPDGTKEVADTFCSDSDIACTTPTDPNAPMGRAFLKDDILPGRDLLGAECSRLATAEKALPTVPPPPPPPCAQPIVNGECPEFSSAVGMLGTAPEKFITSLFAVLLSISGGIALLLIVKSGYQMLTSRGNPEGINNGRDQLVAAIVGLIFLVFSFVILQVIGFDILRIPGFTGA